MCHFDGLGTLFSAKEARLWGGVAKESGSLFGEGVYHYTRKQYGQALTHLVGLSEKGNSVVDRCTGKCYEDQKEIVTATT